MLQYQAALTSQGLFKYIYLFFMLHKVGYLFYFHFSCSDEKQLSEEMAQVTVPYGMKSSSEVKQLITAHPWSRAKTNVSLLAY